MAVRRRISEAFLGRITHIVAAKSARDEQPLAKMGAFLRAAMNCFANKNRCRDMLQENYQKHATNTTFPQTHFSETQA